MQENSLNNVQPAQMRGDYSNHLRLVILGKTGNGKSSTSNSLIGKKHFESGSNAAFVTEGCQAVTFNLMGRKLLLVDTPGIGDLVRTEEKILAELKKVMEFTYPGPHAFILCLSVQRFTKDEKTAIELISQFFGKEICRHSMIIFTRVDDLEYDQVTLEQFVHDCRINELNDLITKCRNNYLGVSNRWISDSPKMIEFKNKFLSSLDQIMSYNNQKIYTTDQFEASQKHYEAEKKRIMEANISAKQKEEQLKKLVENFENKISDLERKLQEAIENAKNQDCCVIQ